jgi:hypothetical protein
MFKQKKTNYSNKIFNLKIETIFFLKIPIRFGVNLEIKNLYFQFCFVKKFTRIDVSHMILFKYTSRSNFFLLFLECEMKLRAIESRREAYKVQKRLHKTSSSSEIILPFIKASHPSKLFQFIAIRLNEQSVTKRLDSNTFFWLFHFDFVAFVGAIINCNSVLI